MIYHVNMKQLRHHEEYIYILLQFIKRRCIYIYNSGTLTMSLLTASAGLTLLILAPLISNDNKGLWQTWASTPKSRLGSIWGPQVESSRLPLAQSTRRRMSNCKVTSPQVDPKYIFSVLFEDLNGWKHYLNTCNSVIDLLTELNEALKIITGTVISACLKTTSWFFVNSSDYSSHFTISQNWLAQSNHILA